MNGETNGHGGRFDGPVTVDLLADLQAGLLDDRAAAELRHRARTDPDVARRLAALSRVRREVADLGVDAASAPEVPADVTARVGAALLAQQPVADERPESGRRPRLRTAAAVCGVAAVLVAAGVGTTVLLGRGPADAIRPAIGTAPQPARALPLSDAEIRALLDQPPKLGGLADPQRRVSCLRGLGYATGTTVLGALPLDVAGRTGVLLLLPGDLPDRINAVVVAPNCSSVDTGLLVSAVVDRA